MENNRKLMGGQFCWLIGGRPAMGKTTISLYLAGCMEKGGVVHYYGSQQDAQRQKMPRGSRLNCMIRQGTTLENLILEFGSCLKDGRTFVIDTFQELRCFVWDAEEKQVLKSLRRFAEENDCLFIITSRLSREIEERENPMPCMKDIEKEVGCIECFDGVAYLYREGYYFPEGEKTTRLFWYAREGRLVCVICFGGNK